MSKMYVEPSEYFTESMRKILEEGNKSNNKSIKKDLKSQRRIKKSQRKDLCLVVV
ncbi:hypothetical protein SAMN04487977_11054 [Treponema bryantii]|uniref:Uncharacterized protein n=1 Tax=Treponema bryantii TaxID=163 RepID=A0A1H9IPT5_9SPIR|nr:hypothetical protein [Treponema bryantii]SEQ76405.1 hypothetical protein SAMN04487977_11054 [Treponema bryantii]